MLRLVIEAVSLRAVEIPRRETLVKVAWKSGAVTELHVDRPTVSQLVSTAAPALARLRELAAAGVHDRQIAKQLAAEGFITGMGKRWTMIAVRNMRSHHAIPRTAPSLPTAKPLPDRRDDGLYSVLGAARHFGVSTWSASGSREASCAAPASQGARTARSGLSSTTRPSYIYATLPRTRADD
jgi:hypothetical protein